MKPWDRIDKNNQKRGFTLIEILVVLVIISILTAIAVPTYHQFILKSQRSDAKATLMQIQIEEAKYRVNQNNYGTLAQVWGGVSSTPEGHYSLSISNITAMGYTVSATATGMQAQDTEDGTACNIMSITINGANETRSPDPCW